MFSSYCRHGALTGTIDNLPNGLAAYVASCHYPRDLGAPLLVGFDKSMFIGTHLIQG